METIWYLGDKVEVSYGDNQTLQGYIDGKSMTPNGWQLGVEIAPDLIIWVTESQCTRIED